MQGNAKSIYSVFTENSRFIVPIYQRPYSWRNEHCKQLWDDIVACATGKRDKHFFGSTVRVPDASGMIVIDGQQRITTISLLMLAIRAALVSGEKTATRGGRLRLCAPPDARRGRRVHPVRRLFLLDVDPRRHGLHRLSRSRHLQLGDGQRDSGVA